PTTRANTSAAKGALTLRDQHTNNFKEENFNIKLRIHFLEERLAQLAPDQIDAALKQNIGLKIEKLVLELERELDRLQHAGVSTNRTGSRDTADC
ncbi:microtubule associated-domain-containing protein, partial [Mycena latifolia]